MSLHQSPHHTLPPYPPPAVSSFLVILSEWAQYSALVSKSPPTPELSTPGCHYLNYRIHLIPHTPSTLTASSFTLQRYRAGAHGIRLWGSKSPPTPELSTLGCHCLNYHIHPTWRTPSMPPPAICSSRAISSECARYLALGVSTLPMKSALFPIRSPDLHPTAHDITYTPSAHILTVSFHPQAISSLRALNIPF